MKVIRQMAVVVQPSSEHFRDELLNTARRFQGQGLEVTINNPHMVISQDINTVGGPHFIAVVEGRAEEVNDDPPFAINRESTVPNRRI